MTMIAALARNAPMPAAALLLGVLAIPGTASARPVTYPGGQMSMTEVDGSAVSTQVDYTLNRRLAVGGYVLTEQDGDRISVGAIANVLLVRKNTADSQANVYLMAGAGPSWLRRPGGGRETVASAQIGAEADWETRRWFVGGAGKLSLVGDEA